MTGRHIAMVAPLVLALVSCARSPDGYPTGYEGATTITLGTDGSATFSSADTAVLTQSDGDEWDLRFYGCSARIRAVDPGAQNVSIEMVGETDCAVSGEEVGTTYPAHFTVGTGEWQPSRLQFILIGQAQWTDSTGAAHDDRVELHFDGS